MMICGHCNSEEFNEGTIKLKNGEFQVLIYCVYCGQIMSRKAVRPMPEPKARKSWAERRADAAKREADKPNQLTWGERKSRKGLHPKQATTALPDTTSQVKPSEDDGSTPF